MHARPVRLGDPAGHLAGIDRPWIGAHRRIRDDSIVQLLQDVVAELPRRDFAVADEHELLDAHGTVFVDGKDELHRAIAGDDVALGDARAQEALSHVESAQSGCHLLPHLRVDRFLVRGRRRDPELRHQHGIGERAISAHVEAHHRASVHRNDDARAVRRHFLEQGRFHRCAEPSRPPIPCPQAAYAFVERGQVEHVARLQLERGAQLISLQRQIAGEAHLGDAGQRTLVDAQLQRHPFFQHLGGGRNRRVAVPDPVVRGADRFRRARDQVVLELGVHL